MGNKRTKFAWTLIGTHRRDKNINRKRHYGLRVGDIVNATFSHITYWNAEVIYLMPDDNNSVQLKMTDGTIKEWVAEWCDVVIKIEDKIIK